MIADCVDGEEPDYFDKPIETQRETLDSDGSDQGVTETTNLNVGHDHSPGAGKTEYSLASTLDTEGDTSSEISLQMELPMTETVLEQIITNRRQQQSPSSSDSGSDEVVFQESTLDVKNVGHKGDVCDEHSVFIVSAVEESSTKRDSKTDEVNQVFDEQISEQSSEQELNLVEDRSNINQPVLESHSAPQGCSEGAPEREIDSASNEMLEETLTAANTETPEYYAALAAFECGTPKQVDSIWEIERSGEANVSYEGQGLNIVPGIHKNHDTRSRSSSGSFNGSGSFKQGLHRGSRLTTVDSNYRTSSFGSDAPSSSWPGGSSVSSRKSSRGDVTVGSPGSESQFSEYEMFDELLGLEEDHFSPPEVSVNLLD